MDFQLPGKISALHPHIVQGTINRITIFQILNIKKCKELLEEACDEIVEGSEFLMMIRFRV